MGKIKTKLIKRTSRALLKEDIEFSEDFKKNKLFLGSTMPGKKIRNQKPEYLSRLKRAEAKKKAELAVSA